MDGGSCGPMWVSVVGFTQRDWKISHKTASVFVDIQSEWLSEMSLLEPSSWVYSLYWRFPCTRCHTIQTCRDSYFWIFALWFHLRSGENPFGNWHHGLLATQTNYTRVRLTVCSILTGGSARRWGTENQITRNHRSPCGCRLFQSTY